MQYGTSFRRLKELGFQIEPRETALVVIDMQNSFCHDQGALAKSGRPISCLKAIIPNVKKLVSVCREAQIPVIWSQQKHYPDDVARRRHKIPSHLDKTGTIVCLKGTWDAEIVDELKNEISADDDVIEKHRSSFFYNTTLEVVLRMRGISLLIISGVASDYCVESTIRDAYARDYDIIVVEDCIASGSEQADRSTLMNVEKFFGLVLSLEELSEELRKAK